MPAKPPPEHQPCLRFHRKAYLTVGPEGAISEAQCHMHVNQTRSDMPLHGPGDLLLSYSSGVECPGAATVIRPLSFWAIYSPSLKFPHVQNKCNYSVRPLRVIIKFNEIIYFIA